MSWLFIDTHSPESYRLGWLDDSVSIKTYTGRANDLLEKLGAAKTLSKRCAGVCVVAGPGSFSSVRLGVLQANLLSRLLGVPLVGISVDEASDLKAISYQLKARELKPADYIAPMYDAEPNITIRQEKKKT